MFPLLNHSKPSPCGFLTSVQSWPICEATCHLFCSDVTERLVKFKMVAESQNHGWEHRNQKMLTGLWDESRYSLSRARSRQRSLLCCPCLLPLCQTKTVAGQGNPVVLFSWFSQRLVLTILTSFIVPTAYILSTSDLRPLILMRMLVPFSITCSPSSVHCGGVAFASNLISAGIIYPVLVGRQVHKEGWIYTASYKCLQRPAVYKEACAEY